MAESLLGKVVVESDIKTYSFKNQWLNMCLYMPQFRFRTKRNPDNNLVCDFLIYDRKNCIEDNNLPLGGKEINTVFMANGDNYKTEFILIDKRDLVNMYERLGAKHGFTSQDLPALYGKEYHTEYNPINNKDKQGIIYFFRGLLKADSLSFLRAKNII